MADKIRCPKCGTENYTTDVFCLNCGANLREPPAPSEAKTEEKAEMTPLAPASSAQRGKQEESPPRPPSALESAMPFIRALGIAVGLTLIEVILIYALNKDHQYPKSVWGFRFPLDMVPKILVATRGVDWRFAAPDRLEPHRVIADWGCVGLDRSGHAHRWLGRGLRDWPVLHRAPADHEDLGLRY